MPLRRVQFPQDWRQIGQVISESFQYPENDNWSVQADERDEFISMSRNLRRIWPIIRVTQAINPVLKDVIDGVVWEEKDRIVGTTFIQRLGSTSTWYVMGVGVLPDFRRRGMARQLMQAAIDLVRDRGGSQIILNVIEGNKPAVALYKDLGMEIYDGSFEFVLETNQVVQAPDLPDGFQLSTLDFFDWEPRFELEKRITPEKVAQYDAIEPNRYRQPRLMRLLMPLVLWAQGIRRQGFQLTAPDGSFIGYLGLMVPTRGKGSSRIKPRLDPSHGDLAAPILSWCLQYLNQVRPDGKVESSVPRWMELMAEAHRQSGFELRYSYLSMGMKLATS
jgi:ribosomal protein S18 acetylase RimI-like enzyme